MIFAWVVWGAYGGALIAMLPSSGQAGSDEGDVPNGIGCVPNIPSHDAEPLIKSIWRNRTPLDVSSVLEFGQKSTHETRLFDRFCASFFGGAGLAGIIAK